MNRKLISIIIPCYNEEESIERTYTEIKKFLPLEYDYEIIFVDNGSPDRSAEIMRKLVAQDPVVKAVLLSRNFGAEVSGQAGLFHAKGDAMIIIAADLQDPPELIAEFLKRWEEGYEIVLGQVKGAEEGWAISKLRKWFYKILRRVSYIDIPAHVTGFGLIDRRVNETLKIMPEKNRFYRGLLAWSGFKRSLVPYQRAERKHGKSSYKLFDYFKHAEQGLFAFSTLPLDILTFLGLFLVVLSVIIIVVYTIVFFVYGNPIHGAATLFLGIMFFGGIQILAISILGKYIAVIFEETKNRPHYIVKEIVSQEKQNDRKTLG